MNNPVYLLKLCWAVIYIHYIEILKLTHQTVKSTCLSKGGERRFKIQHVKKIRSNFKISRNSLI
jgi:hypothetical protein